MAGRRDEVLEAAVRVLGTGGPRRLTYQAVDAAAGVPNGTTSNHFRSRALLIEGIVTHIRQLDAQDWERFAAAPAPPGPEGMAAALARTVRHVLGPARHRTAARYALALESVASPEVREHLARAQDRLLELTAGRLRELGSPTPLEHCRMLFDYLDGVIFHGIVRGEEDRDVEPGIRVLLRAFLADTAAR
ncbi:TetR/AcrR family transcriptional regulator [Streptomyces albus]|uniref:TetR/AcrR family transcriptional regulator n=1 Tax=Streptomyces TaxID=1883 RepID=UPI0004C1B8BB|nr:MULTISPECIES: TetR/AcrR family transcriptional regulator [Streptomyces]